MEKLKKKEKPFIFLGCKGWSKGILDRGGIQFLIQAYIEEFTKKDNVLLKLKINSAYNTSNWNIKDEINKLGIKKNKESPLIMCSNNNVSYSKLPQYYKGNVFISTSMGEAFNLPCLEAMACGIPVITTNFGGQLDFINEKNGWLVPYKLIESYDLPINEGINWALPNIKELRKIMRFVYENSDKVKEKSQQTYITASQYSWTNSAEKLIKEIKKYN